MFAADGRQALGLISKADRILVVTHVSPDGDAIGSLLATGRILKTLGKSDIVMACDDAVPVNLGFLPGARSIARSVAPPFDLAVSVDCSDERRGGESYRAAVILQDTRPPVINIDHHVTNTNFGDINLVLPETVSSTEVLMRLLKVWGAKLDRATAVCLLTGLVTDTLCFRTANVTPAVMRVAGELMEKGAELSDITRHTVNRRSFDAIRYWSMLLQTAKLDEGIVSVRATRDDRRAAGYQTNGDASIVSFLITAWEANIAVSFVEEDDGRVEVSLRAKPGYDISGLALELGGGGHPTAAGCTVEGPLEQVVGQVVSMLKEAQHAQMRHL